MHNILHKPYISFLFFSDGTCPNVDTTSFFSLTTIGRNMCHPNSTPSTYYIIICISSPKQIHPQPYLTAKYQTTYHFTDLQRHCTYNNTYHNSYIYLHYIPNKYITTMTILPFAGRHVLTTLTSDLSMRPPIYTHDTDVCSLITIVVVVELTRANNTPLEKSFTSLPEDNLIITKDIASRMALRYIHT